jgi:hypothetical protein
MPMLDAPGSRKEVSGAEAARLQAYDMSVRSLLEIVRGDRVGPVSSKALSPGIRPVITGQYGIIPPGLMPEYDVTTGRR